VWEATRQILPVEKEFRLGADERIFWAAVLFCAWQEGIGVAEISGGAASTNLLRRLGGLGRDGRWRKGDNVADWNGLAEKDPAGAPEKNADGSLEQLKPKKGKLRVDARDARPIGFPGKRRQGDLSPSCTGRMAGAAREFVDQRRIDRDWDCGWDGPGCCLRQTRRWFRRGKHRMGGDSGYRRRGRR